MRIGWAFYVLLINKTPTNQPTPENSKIGDALAKMEKDKLPNFLFREVLIFWHSFSSVIKDGWDEKKSRRYMFRETIFSP